MFNFEYASAEGDSSSEDLAEVFKKLGTYAIVEIKPDNAQSDEFWREWGQL